MALTYIRQTLSAYATEGATFEPPEAGYVLLKAELIGTSATWALIWGPAPDDGETYD